MRPTAATLVLLATGGLLAGCGSGGHAARTTPSGSAARTGKHSLGTAPGSASLTQAQAVAFAHAVNLRAIDVPGFRVSRENKHKHESATEKRLQQDLRACVGSADESADLAEASSQEFERKALIASQTVSSEVTVQRTPAAAVQILAAFRSGRIRKCLSHYFSTLLESQKFRAARIGRVSIKQGSPPAPGATGGFALRLTATITVDRIQIPFYVDVLGFVASSSEVSLSASGVARPFPAALEERLFSLLLERAKAHAA